MIRRLLVGRSTLIAYALLFACAWCTPASAQWSTSTNADSALQVCWGYFPSIVTFEDGSSIICGALNDYRFVQKLDPYGHKVWPEQVMVYYTPGTNDPFLTGMMDDGDGGVFLWWRDYRDGDEFPGPIMFGPMNNALFLQRVDKYGICRWQSGGVQIDTIAGGLKSGFGTKDGAGGILFYEVEAILDSSGAVDKAYGRLMKFDADGNLTWKYVVDSIDGVGVIEEQAPRKLGARVMILTQAGPRFFDPLDGSALPQPMFVPDGKILMDGDSALFNITRVEDRFDGLGRKFRQYLVTHVNSAWESDWTNRFEIYDPQVYLTSVPFTNTMFPDRLGGLFYWEPTSNDSSRAGTRLRRITQYGSQFNSDEVQVFPSGPCWGFNGVGKIGIYTESGQVFAFDTSGSSLLPPGFDIMSNPENTYALQVATDFNGGAIVTFWTTAGWIYAHHTGRGGRIGEITRVSSQTPNAHSLALGPNYPNPFNPTTKIPFDIAAPALVTLRIYDMLGREVVTLLADHLQVGSYAVTWNAQGLASGVYFCVLRAGQNTLTRTMILVR